MRRTFFARTAALVALLLCSSAILSVETDSQEAQQTKPGCETVGGAYVITDLEISGVQRIVKIWPTELKWGDNIYCCCYDFNDSESPFAYVESDRNEFVSFWDVSISVPESPNTKLKTITGTEAFSYSLNPNHDRVYIDYWDPKNHSNLMDASQESTNRKLDDILPGERSVAYVAKSRLPFPNDDKMLQEYGAIFKDSENVVCDMSVKITDFNTDGSVHKRYEYKLPIRVKKRNEAELSQLNEWDVRSNAFQEYSKSLHFTADEHQAYDYGKLRSLASFSFPRDSHMNMTEEAWEEAENLLQPCDARDEITYGKTLISYYTEQDDEKAFSKRNELVSWLMERPEPQRFFMIDKFYHISQFSTEPFKRRHVDLLDEIYRRDPTANLRRHMVEQLAVLLSRNESFGVC